MCKIVRLEGRNQTDIVKWVVDELSYAVHLFLTTRLSAQDF